MHWSCASSCIRRYLRRSLTPTGWLSLIRHCPSTSTPLATRQQRQQACTWTSARLKPRPVTPTHLPTPQHFMRQCNTTSIQHCLCAPASLLPPTKGWETLVSVQGKHQEHLTITCIKTTCLSTEHASDVPTYTDCKGKGPIPRLLPIFIYFGSNALLMTTLIYMQIKCTLNELFLRKNW